MKILLVTNRNPNFANTNTFREKAVRDLGHECLFFDDSRFLLPGRLRGRWSILQRWDVRRANARLLEVAFALEPDICVAVGGFYNLPATIKALQDRDIPVVLWTTDAPNEYFLHILRTAQLYDHVFCAGTEAMDLLASCGVANLHWLPFACDPELHRPTTLSDHDRQVYGRDVAFVGAFYANRWQTLKSLVGACDLGIWGPGWERAQDRRLKGIVTSGYVEYTKWVKIFGAAKIVVVVHYQDGSTPCHQASPKVFEALACNAFVLVDGQRDVLSLFRSGTHLVSFTDVADLTAKVDYYLAHESERRAIAAAGYAAVIQLHTYRHRIHTILDHALPRDRS